MESGSAASRSMFLTLSARASIKTKTSKGTILTGVADALIKPGLAYMVADCGRAKGSADALSREELVARLEAGELVLLGDTDSTPPHHRAAGLVWAKSSADKVKHRVALAILLGLGPVGDRLGLLGRLVAAQPLAHRYLIFRASSISKIKAIISPPPPLFFPPTQTRGLKLREGGSTSNPNKKLGLTRPFPPTLSKGLE
eukprot:scaffold23219_cov131-Isochrysis_galbana.AAC.2